MIKGVNKQVLEISETQNGFFEKAIFFVKPEYSGMGEGRLRESAEREIESAGKPPLKGRVSTKVKIQKYILWFSLFAVGVVVGIASATLF